MNSAMLPTSVTVPPPAAPPSASMTEPFVCSECARRSAGAGDCSCGAGMLYDLRDPAMVDALRDDDQRRVERAKQRNIWISVVVGVATGATLLAVNPGFLLLIPLPIPFANPAKVVLLTLGVAALVMLGMNQLFPGVRRFPYLAFGAHPGVGRMKSMKGSTVAAIGLGVGAAVATTVGLAIALSNSSPNPNRPGSKPKGAAAPALKQEHGSIDTDDFAPLARGVTKLQGKVDLDGGGHGLLYARGRGAWTACTVRPEDASRPVDCAELSPPLRESSVHLVAGQSRLLIGGVTKMGATPEETEYGVFDASGEKIASSLDGYSLSDGERLPTLGDTWVDVRDGADHVTIERRAGGLFVERTSGASTLLMQSAEIGQPVVLATDGAAVLVFVRGGTVQALRVSADGAAAVSR